MAKIHIYDPGHSNLSQVISSVFDKPEVIYARSAGDMAAAFGRDGTRKSTNAGGRVIIPATTGHSRS